MGILTGAITYGGDLGSRLVKRTIKAFIYPEDDGYVVECPDVRVFTQGDTLDQAITHLREAVALALEGEDPAEYGLAPDPAILVTLEVEPLTHGG
jgi:predicted RNase H-like HicB family nuclease